MYKQSHDWSSRRRRKKGIKNVFEEIMAGNFPNLKKKITHVMEAQRVPNKVNPTNTHTDISQLKCRKLKTEL